MWWHTHLSLDLCWQYHEDRSGSGRVRPSRRSHEVLHVACRPMLLGKSWNGHGLIGLIALENITGCIMNSFSTSWYLFLFNNCWRDCPIIYDKICIVNIKIEAFVFYQDFKVRHSVCSQATAVKSDTIGGSAGVHCIDLPCEQPIMDASESSCGTKRIQNDDTNW